MILSSHRKFRPAEDLCSGWSLSRWKALKTAWLGCGLPQDFPKARIAVRPRVGSRTFRGELTSLSRDGMSATFAYDGVGRRAAKTVNGTSTSFLYDGWNAVKEDDGSLLRAVTLSGLGLDTALSRRVGDDEKTLLTDALGSTVATVGGAGQLAKVTYGPFGEGGAPADQPIQYTGRENDGTGLLHYRHRYYSPSLKRFVSEDPAGAAGSGNNLYAYVNGDPINATDPLGLWPSLQDFTNFAAGFGDAASFGLTSDVRELMGTNGVVEKSSGLYAIGAIAGEEVRDRVTGGVSRIASAGRRGTRSVSKDTPGVGEYLATNKAPTQVTPGTRVVRGHYNNNGRIEPYEAHYDEYGRQIGRTDMNAGNPVDGIPDTHHHVYEYGPGHEAGREAVSHAAGPYRP